MGLLSSIGGLFKSVLGWLTPEPPQTESGFSLEQSGTNNSIPVIYGLQKEVPVIKVLKVSSDRSGGPWNDYLHFICIVCEGEVEELGTVYFNGISENQIDEERYYIERFTGRDTQTASAELLSEFPTWQATSELNGLAYLYVRLRINSSSSWWQGEPKVTVDVKGKKVLDVRTGNVVYSQNPALCLYDFALNSRYGKGLPAYKVDAERIKEEADFFEIEREYERTVTNIQFNDDEDIDENSEEYINDRYWSEVTGTTSITENLINCNVRLDTEKTVKENLQVLLKGMRGIMPESNGKYKLTIEKEAQATYTFTEDTLVGSVEFDGGDQNKRYNRVIIKFRNNETGQDDEVTFPEDAELYAQYLAEDNGKDLEGEFDFPTIGQRSEALQMGHVVLERSREQGRVKITGTPETVVVEAGDIVAIPNKRFGWVNKPFRIEIMEVDNETGECGFQAVEHQNTIYPWAISSVVEKFVDTTFALPADVRVPTGLRWTEETDNEIRQGLLSWNADRSSLVVGYSGRIYQGDVLVDSFDENTSQFALKSLRPGNYRLELSTYNSLFYSDAAVLNFTIANIPTTSLFTWVRYADDETGAGITGNSEGKIYIGFAYNKSVVTPSNNKNDYTWSKIQGEQGADGINGLQGEDGADGIPGTNGQNGTNGTNGQTPYFHIAYADNASGGGFSQNPTSKAYIGTYSDFTAADSTNPSLYNWQLVQGAQGEDGADGIPGINGDNGQTSYLHIAYANNSTGTNAFSVSDSNRLYIGQYTDFTVNDSINPSVYSWTLIRGSDGSNGADGSNGLNGSNGQDGVSANANLHLGLVATGAVNIDETGQVISKAGGVGGWDSQVYSTLGFNGAAVATVVVAGGSKGAWMFGIGQDPTTNASFNSIDYALYPQSNGTLGIYENGSSRGNFGTYTEDDVLSVIYDGRSVKYLKNGLVLRELTLSAGRTMYFDSSFHTNARTYTKAISFTAAGVSGADGLRGLQGEDGANGIPGTNGQNGTNGNNGQTSYFHIAYADNASGGGFSQNPTGKAYIGTYSDFTAADSTNASSYNWQLVQGAQGEDGSQGIPGVNGNNGHPNDRNT